MNPRDYQPRWRGFDQREEALRQRAQWLASLRQGADRRRRK